MEKKKGKEQFLPYLTQLLRCVQTVKFIVLHRMTGIDFAIKLW